jgi:hypothetical protein
MRKKTSRPKSREYCSPSKIGFEFSYCAIFGGGPCVEWNGKKSRLRWRDAFSDSWHPLQAPSEIQWKAFWLLLEQSGARSWDKEYSNAGILDGTVWDFKMTAPGLRIATAGNNAYPGSDSFIPTPGSPFDILTVAIGILVGCNPCELKAPPSKRSKPESLPEVEEDHGDGEDEPLL